MPVRALRSATLKIPRPGIATRSPFLSASRTELITASSAAAASFFDSPASFAIASTISDLPAITDPPLSQLKNSCSCLEDAGNVGSRGGLVNGEVARDRSIRGLDERDRGEPVVRRARRHADDALADGARERRRHARRVRLEARSVAA